MGIKVDLTGIDLASLIEQETPIRLGKEYGSGEKRTRKGACPWCGGTKRFAVVDSDPPHFYCGIHNADGCHRHGDAVAFLQQWHGISFMDACTRLGVKPVKDGAPLNSTPRHMSKFHLNIDSKPGEDWQTAANYFLARCQQWLWKESGSEALAQLHQRGFSDETIRQVGYGFNPTTLFDKNVARWGIRDEAVKAVWLPRGIVIPWFIGDDLWKINIRRPVSDLVEEEKRTGDKANKYVNVKGGSNPIYRADTIKPGQPLIMFEGEFNADILAQVLKDAGITHIAVIATGSTGKGRADNWLMKIAKAAPILFSFDPDSGGDQAVKKYWAKVLPQALIWPSVGGDLNDMYLTGKDVLKWMKRGLKLVGADMVSPPTIIEPLSTPVMMDPFVCCVCGVALENADLNGQYDECGQAFCGDHYEGTNNVTTLEWDSPVPFSDAELIEQERAYERATWQRIRAARAYVSMPRWLVENTDEWKKEVARCGLTELRARRNAALQERSRGMVA